MPNAPKRPAALEEDDFLRAGLRRMAGARTKQTSLDEEPYLRMMGASANADQLLLQAQIALSTALPSWQVISSAVASAHSDPNTGGYASASLAVVLQTASAFACEAANVAMQAAQQYATRCSAAANAAAGARPCPALDLSNEQAMGTPWGVIWNGQANVLDPSLVPQVGRQVSQAQASVAAATAAKNASCPVARIPEIRPLRMIGADPSTDLSQYGLTQQADGSLSFDGSALISENESAAVGQLGQALANAIQQEEDLAAFAASFTAGVVSAEAGITALAAGGTIAEATAAGAAAGAAAAADISVSLATGPGAALLVLGFAIVAAEGGDIVAFLDGFDPFGSGHEGCCGSPPDPTQHYVLNGQVIPQGITVQGAVLETKVQAAARAARYAIAQNTQGGCAGNHSLVDYAGPAAIISPLVPGDDPRVAPFVFAANNMIYQWVDAAGLTKCWPLTQRASCGHVFAMTLAGWNAVHAGPSVTVTRTVHCGAGPYLDLIALALDWGNLQWMTTQGQGYLGSVLGQVPCSKTISFQVNVGPKTELRPIKMQPPNTEVATVSHAARNVAIGTGIVVAGGLGAAALVAYRRKTTTKKVLEGAWRSTKSGTQRIYRRIRRAF